MYRLGVALSLLLLTFSYDQCFGRQICYENGVGCFSNDPPFDNMPLPMDPVDIPPTYLLLQAGKPNRVINESTELNVDDLIVMTHGLAGSYENTFSWNSKISTKLHVVRPTADILFVDWEKGAALGSGKTLYHQPASNVRVIGKMVAMWLKANPNFDSTKVHCVGFSLGGQFCGFTAKRLETKWGRLSAIDPAGPAFMKDDPLARVDKEDGIVVDVLHASWVGLGRPIGHKDFYVNDARVQPGCISKRKRRSATMEQEIERMVRAGEGPNDRIELTDIFDFLGCSHYRAAHLYSETIVPLANCTFQFCPCPSMEHFEKGYCRTCSPSVGALLGYRSIETTNTGSFYGATTATEPYCLP